MKLTTNYVVYLNADNKVHCAKCRITGRFIKRSIAQVEYEEEYNYFSSSILTTVLLFAIMYLSNLVTSLENTMDNTMTTVTMNLDQVLTHFNKGRTIVLFTHLNTYLFKSKVNSKDEMIKLLNTGEVKTGRIL